MTLLRFLLLVIFAAPGAAMAQSRSPDCPTPQSLSFQVSSQTRRDVPGFTEGLEFHDGALWESTGDVVGETRINRIDRSGKVTALRNDHRAYFGEGLTFLGGRIYQMSWREHRVFVFDLAGRLLREMHNPREGWGLTHDDSRLIASDGSGSIFFLSPEDFRTLGSVTVMSGDREITNINELEYAGGAIWANIFEDTAVLKISPVTGCVEGWADLRGLYDRLDANDRRKVEADGNFVLNGIAHDPVSGLFTVTGKYWPLLFTGRFVAN